jgi:hypothetical protein
MDQVSIKYTIVSQLQDPPKFTQIWIFGLKTNHLATMFSCIFLRLRKNAKIRGREITVFHIFT